MGSDFKIRGNDSTISCLVALTLTSRLRPKTDSTTGKDKMLSIEIRDFFVNFTGTVEQGNILKFNVANAILDKIKITYSSIGEFPISFLKDYLNFGISAGMPAFNYWL